ncbi:hypothetical protein K504DRAFT_501538 [Pleomassaria siparia CBS 279.74]|uniref:Uncharacterized protein n=1 Tax=Pleomassaria siparia CBS 279.74 TaxID=1314801 RepID=A0A6G1KBL1_9PLEO|nr:hypothetical protein K504DRAFT_501538 [Pleomassaria siparia CBS 279.74]
MFSKSSPRSSRIHFPPIVCLSIFFLILTSTTLLFGLRSGHLTITAQPQCSEPKNVYSNRVFKEVSDFRSYKSMDAAIEDNSWSNFLPSNGGVLKVEHADGKIGGYGVSMFHQLHCLSMLRDMLLRKPMSHAHETDETDDWSEDNLHWLHCFDYIAQGILCAADDTLEKPDSDFNVDGLPVTIDGMGYTHQCKNSSHLWQTVEKSQTVPLRDELIGSDTVFKS